MAPTYPPAEDRCGGVTPVLAPIPMLRRLIQGTLDQKDNRVREQARLRRPPVAPAVSHSLARWSR
jgi:hypothetical protein